MPNTEQQMPLIYYTETICPCRLSKLLLACFSDLLVHIKIRGTIYLHLAQMHVSIWQPSWTKHI